MLIGTSNKKNLEREENNQCSRILNKSVKLQSDSEFNLKLLYSITYNAKKCIVGNQESGKNPDDEFIYL